MKVTKTGAKGSQLPKEGSLQTNSTEYEGYAGVHIPVRITETDDTNANESRDGMLEKIVSRDNLNEAFKRVKAKKGSHGIDGMGVDELLQYLKENGETIKQSILDGKYRPSPVRRVEIPKENGKMRNLGIPTVNAYCTPPNLVLDFQAKHCLTTLFSFRQMPRLEYSLS